MKVLSIDPGAKRLGYACISLENDEYRLLFSGIKGLERGTETFQAYRMNLIRYWVNNLSRILIRAEYAGALSKPNIVSEILPAVGGGNFAVATQNQLVLAALTTCQALAIERDFKWSEISAPTIKKNVTGLKPKEATKIQVRNAVLEVFPELKPRKKDIIADETDAIAIGLAGLGYKHGTKAQNPQRSLEELPYV